MSRLLMASALLWPAALCGLVKAQETPSESLYEAALKDEGSCLQNFCNQPTLTGDWCGVRSSLQDCGVTFAGRSTHFGFGVSGGVDVQRVRRPLIPGNSSAYTGRGEYDAIFDLEKFGGLPKGTLLVRLEHWYGEYGNVSLRTGAFAPAVFPAALPPSPDGEGQPYMTNFVITQPLCESLVVFAGKKDVLGAADQDIFAGGDGTEQFMNQALIANPAFLLGLPYTGFVVGAVSPQSWGAISGFAYDPKDRTREFFEFDDLYANGVILGAELKVNTNFFGRKGEQHVGGMWKHLDQIDLRFQEAAPGQYPPAGGYDPYNPNPPAPGPGGAPRPQTLDRAWTVYYGFDQYLMQYSGEGQKGWGMFGRASLSDGNPTPLTYFVSAGFGGDSYIRKNDKWGVGWYYVGTTDEFGRLPRLLLGPREGTGVEMFYNIQVNGWMNVTPDIQYLRPEASAISKDAVVYGVRVNLTL